MKKTIIAILSFILLVCIATFSVGCGGDDFSLELNYYEYQLEVNHSFKLEYTGCPYAEFSSSDESVATVDKTGVVIGVSEGHAVITVKYEDVSAECNVNVSKTEQANAILSLNIDENISMLKTDSPIQITPRLIVGGATKQAQFVFSSQKTDVATVSETGLLSAVDYGTTAITVSVNYQGKDITKTVIVKVVCDIDIQFEKYDYTLYTTSLDQSQSTEFSPELIGVYVEGVKEDNPALTYRYDDKLLSFNDGNGAYSVISKDSAKTKIVAVYIGVDNQEYTCEINVDIVFPVLDKTQDTLYYIGNWKDSLRGDKSIGREQITFDETVFEEDIVGIYDITTGEEKNLNYNSETCELEDTELIKGSKTWIIYNDTYAVKVSVIVVDMVINTAEEFVNMLSIATDEHIVIGRDIESVGHYQNTANVFSGVLDGNNHTVSGIDFSTSASYGGLFERIDNATIKNIAFKDAVLTVYRNTVEGVTTAYPHGLISYQAYRSQISNIYAQVYSTAGEYEGGLFHLIGAGVVIDDAIIVYKNKWSGPEVGVLSRSADAVVTLNNVYVVKASNIALIKTKAGTMTESDKNKLDENLQQVNTYTSENQLYLYRYILELTDLQLNILEEISVGDNYEEDDFTE